jgi:hypothetical protein
MSGPSTTRRGRPRKFGRPASLVAVTLPEDVLKGLTHIHPDLGWAIVSLFEKRPASERRRPRRLAPAELTNVGTRRALIVVNPEVLRPIEGVTVISLANGPAFIALAPGKGLADLEVATADRLESQGLRAHERQELELLRGSLRAWRRDPHLNVRTQSIIVIERRSRPERRGRMAASKAADTT